VLFTTTGANSYEGGSSILECGASWPSDLLNYSSTDQCRERPLPELNFLNCAESPRDAPKYTCYVETKW
jgi:hypothetical protein